MVAYILAGRCSRAERRGKRKAISLDDAALSEKTQKRYYAALRKLLPAVEASQTESDLDVYVSRWVRKMWALGEPMLTVGDGLSALHFFQPWTKKRIPQAWKLFAIWKRIEIPSRAPPLTRPLVQSMAAYEIDHCNLEMAALLLLSFHCLLRTGEALTLTPNDLILGTDSGICSLKGTKSGKRNSANEAISITDPAVLDTVAAVCSLKRQANLEMAPIWSSSPSAFRVRFKKLCGIFGLQTHCFRPYSLRRGGATFFFQTHKSMEEALIRGRWESSRVARVYIMDALSYLPSIRCNSVTMDMLKKYHL